MVSLLTVLTIQTNETKIEAYGNDEKGYGFEIYSIIREKYMPHITSNPVFGSKEVAEREGEKLLEEIKSLNLDKNKKELSDIIGSDAPKIQEIIDNSKTVQKP